MKLSEYIVTCEIPSASREKDVAVFSTRTGNILALKTRIVHQIKNGDFANIDNETREILINNKVLVPKNEVEILTVLKENTELIKSKEGIAFTVQPTGNCQLACHYCGQIHSHVTMNEYLVEQTFERISTIVKTHGYKRLSVNWYGGEPLMAYKQIFDFSDKIVSFCKEKGVIYESGIITNGVLLKPALFENLVRNCNISYFQITIDGIKEKHDKRRLTKKGKGTFDLIVQNILKCVDTKELEEYNPNINIRLNVDIENVDSVEMLIDHFHKLNLLGKLSFTFSPIFDWGGNKANQKNLASDEFSTREIDWILKINDLGGNLQISLPERQIVPCMVSVENSEVVDAFGNIFSCYELPYTSKYQNDKYIEGNILTDKVVSKNNEMRNFLNNIENRKYNECIDCKFFPVCAGACPKSWINGDVACPSFKYNIEDKVLLYYYLKKSRETTEKFI